MKKPRVFFVAKVDRSTSGTAGESSHLAVALDPLRKYNGRPGVLVGSGLKRLSEKYTLQVARSNFTAVQLLALIGRLPGLQAAGGGDSSLGEAIRSRGHHNRSFVDLF